MLFLSVLVEGNFLQLHFGLGFLLFAAEASSSLIEFLSPCACSPFDFFEIHREWSQVASYSMNKLS